MTEEQMTEAPVEDQVPLSAETPVESETPTEAPAEDAETFPKTYVDKLRQEAADHRVKAKDRDELAGRLHTSLVAATGRLADPSDLPFDEAHLSGTDALNSAIDDLLSRKPHLASRRPSGQIGQGPRTTDPGSVDLAAILRQRAG